MVKVRVTSTQESTPVRTGEVAVSKPACFARSSSSNQSTGAECSHRKKEKHSQDWLCHRDAGMARRRVTSSVKRCGAAAPQLCSIIPPGLELPARMADGWAIRAVAVSTD